MNITAGDIFLDGFNEGGNSGFFNTVAPGATGNSGIIDINTESLSLNNRALINASTFGEGNAGNVIVQADNSISLSNDSLIASTIREGAIGNGGNINIETDSLSLTKGGQLQAAVFRASNDLSGGRGLGGNIIVNSRDSINISGFSSNSFSSSILTITEQGASGDAGNINLNTGKLSLSNSGNVNAATRNSSNGGNITINASILEATSGGQVLATTRSDGNSGNITISINDEVNISGTDPTFFQRLEQFDENFVSDAGDASGLFVNATPNSTGQAGSLILNTEQLNLSQQGTIAASTQSGNGGNIVLTVNDNLTLRNNSLISAQAFNEANGGDIDINTDFIVAFPNQIDGNGSDIIASAVDGDGGNINITAESLLGIQEEMAIEGNQANDIDASSDFGLDGTVSIFTPDINSIQRAIELPSNLVESEQTTAQACEANRESAAKNRLNITGKGGILPEPGSPLNSLNVTVNAESTSATVILTPVETIRGKVQPAKGIKISESGQIILTAHRTNNSGDKPGGIAPQRIPKVKRNCG